MRWTRMLLGAAIALLVSVAPAHAATFRVIGLNDSAQGCMGTQCPSIRSALAAAKLSPVPDTIVVPAGEYFLTSGQLLVDSPVTIVGEGARRTIVHGNPLHPLDGGFRVLEVPSGVDASVAGLALADGHGIGRTSGDTFYAGGIVRNSGTLTLDRVRVTGGHASSGGGIANTGGTLTIERSLIDGNQADIGGGDAGGLLNFNGGTLVVRNSTIANNTAVKGGALFTWSDNGADNITDFEFATVIANQDGAFGGLHYDVAAGDILRLRSTVVAGNTRAGAPRNCSAEVETLGYNVSNTEECGLVATTDRPGVDVRQGNGLTDVGGSTNVWPVAADSPAVNLIPACDGTDQRGVSRPQGSGCDAGAYEHDPVRILTGPEGFINNPWPTFTFTGADHYTCALESQDEMPCFSPFGSEVMTPDGDYVFRLTGYDAEDQVIGRAERAITIDTRIPDAPVITSPQNGATVDEVVLEGTAEPFAIVEVRDTEGDWTETVADAEGAWMLAIPDEPPGQHEYFARQIDRAGNQSEGMDTITLTVSGSEPPVATITNGPPELTNDVHPVFEFEADVPEATFQCRHTVIGNEEIPWDDAPTCTSPHQLR
ncbi:MAG TPA: choice-of-anchor Q domain-containing protein, partial [Solirubrobacter sp.]|nr:choice-of-anchor Q domain-containing protein [Solirubrobacter sp.]